MLIDTHQIEQDVAHRAAELLEVLGANDKKRFELSTGNQRIRASQGHSVSVDLGYQASIPPDMLYHGTVGPFLESIRKLGLTRSSPLCLPRCWAAKRRGDRISIESSSLFLIPGLTGSTSSHFKGTSSARGSPEKDNEKTKCEKLPEFPCAAGNCAISYTARALEGLPERLAWD